MNKDTAKCLLYQGHINKMNKEDKKHFEFGEEKKNTYIANCILNLRAF